MLKIVAATLVLCAVALTSAPSFAQVGSAKPKTETCRTQCRNSLNWCTRHGGTPKECSDAHTACLAGCREPER